MPNSIKITSDSQSVTVGSIGHGLMFMTARSTPINDNEAFETIKAGVDAMPAGTLMVLNSGEFYDQHFSESNLQLLARFFSKYPDYAQRIFLSVKGGMKPNTLEPDGSSENLRRSVETINKVLGGIKKMDLFQPARIPNNVSLEDMMDTLVALKKEGHYSYIGLSECRASTLKKAHAIHPISVVEIELSMWSYEQETKSIVETAKELGVVIAAYSPLGNGFLTGRFKSPNDLPEGDMRRFYDRFTDQAFKHNVALTDATTAIAQRKGVTPGQLAIAWVVSRGAHVMPIPGSSNKNRNLENIAAGGMQLSEEELAEIDKILADTVVQGDRYYTGVPHLWG